MWIWNDNTYEIVNKSRALVKHFTVYVNMFYCRGKPWRHRPIITRVQMYAEKIRVGFLITDYTYSLQEQFPKRDSDNPHDMSYDTRKNGSIGTVINTLNNAIVYLHSNESTFSIYNNIHT